MVMMIAFGKLMAMMMAFSIFDCNIFSYIWWQWWFCSSSQMTKPSQSFHVSVGEALTLRLIFSYKPTYKIFVYAFHMRGNLLIVQSMKSMKIISYFLFFVHCFLAILRSGSSGNEIFFLKILVISVSAPVKNCFHINHINLLYSVI